MEDMLYNYPDLLLGEPLKPIARQRSSPVGRADLIFEHPNGYRLVVEVKLGVAPRGVGDQLHDYWGAEKAAHPDTPIEMMVVANEIPRERRLYLEKRDIAAKEIPVKRFRDVAARVGHLFTSEQGTEAEIPSGPAARGTGRVRDAPRSFPPPRVGPALLMNLEPANLEAVFAKGREHEDICLGTDCHIQRIQNDQIRYVYFKANGRKPIEVSARAELVKIEAEKPRPEHRLPGYEEEDNHFYLRIRSPEYLGTPIRVESLLNYNTRRHLPKSVQGVQEIDDPLS